MIIATSLFISSKNEFLIKYMLCTLDWKSLLFFYSKCIPCGMSMVYSRRPAGNPPRWVSQQNTLVSNCASLTDHTVYSFLELKNIDVAIFEGYWDIKHNFILVILKKRKHKVQKYSAFGRGLFHSVAIFIIQGPFSYSITSLPSIWILMGLFSITCFSRHS